MSHPPRRLIAWVTGRLPDSIADSVAGDLEERWHADAAFSRARAWRRLLILSATLHWHAFRTRERSPMSAASFGQSVLHAMKFTVRLARRDRLATAATLLTLALGVGATSALFAVVDAWLLRPLPFGQPERLVVIWETIPSADIFSNTPAPASVTAWKENAASFEAIAPWTIATVNLTGLGDAERLRSMDVAPELLDTLRTTPAMGRNFSPRDAAPGAAPVTIVSHAFWRTRLGSDPAAIGRAIALDGRPFEVIGVLPPQVPLLGYSYDLWRPLVVSPTDENRMLWVVARLRPGVTIEAASAEASAVNEARAGNGMPARVAALQDETVGPVGRDVLTLFAATSLVLLIACANVASLTLARISARRQEFTVRGALGAGRGQLAGQVLIESALVGLAGAAAGLVLAGWMARTLLALAPDAVGQAPVAVFDPRVVFFTVVIAVVTSMIFGVFPAWQAARGEIAPGLATAGRGVVAGRRFLGSLVIVETALALALLTAAGLVLQSYLRLGNVSLGFDARGLVFADIPRPDRDAGEDQFYARLEERLRATPGVTGVAMSQGLPLKAAGSMGGGFAVRSPQGEQGSILSYWRLVNDGYFDALRQPIVRGRALTFSDTSTSRRVAVVSESFARRAWGDEDPIGRQIGWVNFDEPMTVVGVAADIRQTHRMAPGPHVYMPYRQIPVRAPSQIALRADASPEATIDLLRRAVRELAPDQPVAAIMTGEQQLARALRRQRFQAVLITAFGAAAGLLALVGVYGVLSFTTNQQRREIGLRLALGAAPSQVRRLVLRRGLGLAATGAAIGLALAVAASRIVEGFLHDVPSRDVATYSAATVLLLVAAAGASAIPARRAGRVDPMIALRD